MVALSATRLRPQAESASAHVTLQQHGSLSLAINQQETALPRLQLPPAGEMCANAELGAHPLLSPEDDEEFQTVLNSLQELPVLDNYTQAIQAATEHVLDGPKTGRFDLNSPDVDSGERRAVGAKLEYELLRVFHWKKEKPLDIKVSGTPVDIKATVGDNWSIPKEAHCQLCLCTKIDPKLNRHKTWLVRTHRSWLYGGKGNNDGKRGLAADALDNLSTPLYEWAPLPINPLLKLTPAAIEEVFAESVAQETRLLALFRHLPCEIIPRSTIETVGWGWKDPLRRARAVREAAAKEGLLLLCGTWADQRAQASALGYPLRTGDWIAIPSPTVSK
ncbi:NaeI family type II restriction endonuclease [Streptomyces milbemycinicus]|uniref:NaeI family type II restriction endonuclease n=1 Tax=Streptomyces milbemycinicus TaxID=476552 RepID=A0ABW8LZJ3_9ACTN